MMDLKSQVADLGKHKALEATVIDVVGNKVAIKVSSNGQKIYGVKYYGGQATIGDTVRLDYTTGQPVAFSLYEDAQTPRTVTIKRTIGAPKVPESNITDHGSLTGLGDSQDHTWALLKDGTRPLEGDWAVDTDKKIKFRTDTNYIHSPTSGSLAIVADGDLLIDVSSGTISLESDVINIGTGTDGVDLSINFLGFTNQGELEYFEDEDLFNFESDVQVQNALYLESTDYWIKKLGSPTYAVEVGCYLYGIVLNAGDGYSDPTVYIGKGTDDLDPKLVFWGNSSGYIQWMEDESYFEFGSGDNILIPDENKIYFNTTSSYLTSSQADQIKAYVNSSLQLQLTDNHLVSKADFIEIGSGTATSPVMVWYSSGNTGYIWWDSSSNRFLFPDTMELEEGLNLIGSQKEFRLYEGANYVGFKAPALTGDQIWSLPTADGTVNQVLKTDGSGALGWADPGGGGAPTDAQYLVLSYNGTLTAERLFTPGDGLAGNDGGAGSTYTVNVDISPQSDIGTPDSGDLLLIEDITDGSIKKVLWSEVLTASSGGVSVLDDLTDVVITSVGDNDLLAYDTGTSKWINQTPTEAGFATVATSGDHGDLTGKGDDDHTQYIRHNLSTAQDDFLVGSGSNTYIKKTLEETGAILELDMQHDNLQGVTTNEHIDHSTVTLTAGNGLSGGGTIDDNRSFALDLDELGIETTIASGDFIAMVDITDSGSQKITLTNLVTGIEGIISHDDIQDTHNLTTDIDHDQLTNTHNLTTDIDHDQLTNTHNLTSDIDHDQLTNFTSTEHFTEASIDHGSIDGLGDDDHTQYIRHNLSTAANDFLVGSGSNTFIKKTLAETGAILEGDIQHDNLQGITSDEHIDHSSVTLTAGNGLSGGGDITQNRSFALDLNELGTETAIASGDFIAMVDITDNGSQKITFANFEGDLDHDNLTNAHNLTTDIDHDLLTNFESNEHFTEASIDHGSIDGLGDDDHTQYILHSLATAANDFLVASGSGAFVKKTLSETGAILEGDIDHGNLQGLSTGADHSYINQDVTTSGTPTFVSLTIQSGDDVLTLGVGSITWTGGAVPLQYFEFQPTGTTEPAAFYSQAPSGATPNLYIFGYRSGDALRSLEIAVGADAADTASFDGLSNYWFDGKVIGNVLESEVSTGTAPLIIASTTLVSNLNADQLDSQEGSYYLDSDNFTGTEWGDLTDSGATTLHKHDHGGMDGLGDDDHTQYIRHNLSTAQDDFLVGSGSNTFIKKTLSETCTILETDLDHDSLQGVTTDEHIDHSTVTLTAGNGLSGGGTIWESRTFALDLNELGTETSIASGDFIAMVDITDSGSQKITLANLVTGIESIIDHGDIQGIGDDDHTIYLLADGTRNLTGNLLVTSTNQIQFQDSGTYIYSSTDGQLDVVADGTIELNAPDVVIGSGAASTDYKLTFDGNTYDVSLELDESEGQLLINMPVNAGAMRLIGDYYQGFWSECYSTNLGEFPYLGFVKSHTESRETLTETLTGEYLGELAWVGMNSTPSNVIVGAIRMQQDGSAGASYVPGYMEFKTSDGTSAHATRLTIQKNGDILVASDNPIQFNDTGTYIYSSTDGQLDIISDGTLNLEFASTIEIDDTGDSGFPVDIDQGASLSGSYGYSNLRLKPTGNDTNYPGFLVKIDANGTTESDRMVGFQLRDGDGTVGLSAAYLPALSAMYTDVPVQDDDWVFRMGGSLTVVLTFDGSVPTIVFNEGLKISDGKNIVVESSTGTKIGTTTGQKIGFWNATPVTQRSHIADPSADVNSLKTAVDAALLAMEQVGILASS